MRGQVCLMLPALALMAFTVGCGGGENSGVKILYVEPGEKGGMPGDPFPGGPTGERSPVQEALSRGQVEDNLIILEPEDTLNLLAEWSGISLESLLEDNPRVRDFGLQPGDGFLVRLTKSEFMAFFQLREAHRIKRRVMRDRNVEIDHVIDYVVQKGETSATIAEKFGAPLNLFENLNPYAKSLALQPGQVVKVPIMKNAMAPVQEDVAGSKAVRERLPGPPAPNPTPVPVPPPTDGRKLLVGPQPAGN